MANSKTKKIITLAVVFIAVLGLGGVVLRAFFFFPSDEVVIPGAVVTKSPEDTKTATQIKVSPGTKAIAATVPEVFSMHLTIPTIKVDAKIVDLGINAKGNMAAPRKFSDVGWYKYGTFPGEVGSSVIAGHVDNGVGLAAVFANLKDLKVGDDIYVDTTESKKLHFVVTGSKIYAFDSAPKEVFNDKSGRILNLITCSGTFMSELRTHSKRLVVSAVLSDK